MKKLLIVISILMFLVAIGLFFYFKSSSKKKENIITEKVKRGNLAITVDTDGVIVPFKKVDIKSKIEGRIKGLFVDEGDKIKAGDLVAKIESKEYQAGYDEAKANLQAVQTDLKKIELSSNLKKIGSKNRIKQAEKILQQEKSKLEEAERDLKRVKQLKSRNLISQSEVDNAQTSYDLAKLQYEEKKINLNNAKEELDSVLKINQQEVKSSQARVQSAKAQLNFAKEKLNYTNILSPISGLVTFRGVEIGDMVASEYFGKASGTTIVTVSDLSSLFVETKIDEVDIGMIKMNQPASIIADAFPDYKIKGKVNKIALQSSSSLQSQEGTSTFFVKIKILNPFEKLKPGMNCKVSIMIANLKGTLYIPIESVIKEGKKEFVKIKVKDKVLRKEIKTGLNNVNFIQVTQGLKENEEVVILLPELKKK